MAEQGIEETEDQRAARVLDEMLRSRKEQAGPTWPPTEKQVSYALILQTERQLPDGFPVKTKEELEAMERDQVSSGITLLREMPRKDNGPSDKAGTWDMPAGRYCILIDGGPEFFQIDKPQDGRWKGYTFIKRLVGAPGDYKQVAIAPADRFKYMAAIQRDSRDALLRFGKETRQCGICHSPLTVKESRDRGIGPVCAKKMGW